MHISCCMSPLPPHPSLPQAYKLTTTRKQRRLRHRGKHLPPLHLWRRLPPLQHIHVQRPRRQLGRQLTRLRRPRSRPHSHCLLQVRPSHQGEE